MIYRIDVRTRPAAREGRGAFDPAGEAIRHQIREFGVNVGPVTVWRVFLVDTDASREQVERVARELVADPVVDEAVVVNGKGFGAKHEGSSSRIEVHLKAGVMDPVAASTETAIRDMGLPVREVRTGRAFVIEGRVDRKELERIGGRILANGVIESVHFDAFVPREFPAGHAYTLRLRHVPIRELSDEQLQKRSEE